MAAAETLRAANEDALHPVQDHLLVSHVEWKTWALGTGGEKCASHDTAAPVACALVPLCMITLMGGMGWRMPVWRDGVYRQMRAKPSQRDRNLTVPSR